MENYIIIAVITAALLVGILYTVRHFKGKGGCCGGGGYKPKRKRLSEVKYHKTFSLSGMHCEHCKVRVEESVNDIKGVAAKVDLKKHELTVFYEEDVDDGTIVAKIQRAGYTVIR